MWATSRKRLVSCRSVEREHLLIDVGDEQILPAVAIEIGGVDAHAGARLPVVAEADLRRRARSLPISLAIARPRFTKRKFCTVSLATNRSIRPSLLMSVATTPRPLPSAFAISVPLLDLGERAVAVVVIAGSSASA